MQKYLVQAIHFANNYFQSQSFTESHNIFLSAISHLLKGEKLYCKKLDIIWINDDYLRQLHIQYLNDPEYTDIITFNYADGNTIDGELYISIDRAKEHAKLYNVSLENELSRLIIHGLLHIAGYKDYTEKDKREMRNKENIYLEQTFPSKEYI